MRRKLGKSLCSLLITTTMLFGLFPGMSLTAQAAETTVTWSGFQPFEIFLHDGQSTTKDGVTLKAIEGMAVVDPDDGFMLMGTNDGDSFEFSVAEGKITKIVIACSYGSSTGTGWSGFTWTGSASSVNFGNYANNVTSITFTIEPATVPTYDVSITSGSNMTKTTDSGAASQADLSGAMTAVVYTADDGYYFPTDYSVEAVNGISVTRDSYTQITVSGTPTADAAITLTAPTAKTTPDAPTTAAAVNCTTTDNNDGKLTGVTTAMEYKKSDADSWTDGTGSDITGLVPGTYYVRVKATDTTLASDNQELTIKGFISYTVTFKVVNGSWDDDTTADKTVTLTGYEGDTLNLAASQIPAVGSNPDATYKAGSWDTTPTADMEITADTTFTYTYAAKTPISYTVTFNVENGSWNNGGSDAQTVTLTGYEGDTLTLAASQIPAVGSNPDATYKAGSWDTTPTADMEITADTTYTYTYEKAPLTGWQKIDGEWYFYDMSGEKQKDWEQIDGEWYYLDPETGAMQTGWKEIDGKWYCLGYSGEMLTGWTKGSDSWYYLDPETGAMQTGWKEIDGKWYFFESSGKMFTGWRRGNGSWYYLNASGAMQIGWLEIDGEWYYFNTDGTMAAYEYCNGYWLDSNGTWTYQYRAYWKQDSNGRWYGDSNGWYAKNETLKIDGAEYTFNAEGYLAET